MNPSTSSDIRNPIGILGGASTGLPTGPYTVDTNGTGSWIPNPEYFYGVGGPLSGQQGLVNKRGTTPPPITSHCETYEDATEYLAGSEEVPQWVKDVIWVMDGKDVHAAARWAGILEYWMEVRVREVAETKARLLNK